MPKTVPRFDGGGHKKRCDDRAYNSREWRKTRLQVLADEPVCMVCQNALSLHVDHIDGNNQNNTRSNLQGICPPCHARKTNEQTRN